MHLRHTIQGGIPPRFVQTPNPSLHGPGNDASLNDVLHCCHLSHLVALVIDLLILSINLSWKEQRGLSRFSPTYNHTLHECPSFCIQFFSLSCSPAKPTEQDFYVMRYLFPTPVFPPILLNMTKLFSYTVDFCYSVLAGP